MEEKDWFDQAEADFRTANNSFLSKDYYASVFWSQQSIEKCLKAIIIKESKKLVKIHDVILLGKMANLPLDLLNKIKLLSGVYVETRYGISGAGTLPFKKFKEKDASEFLNISKEVLEWSRKKI